MDQLWKTRARPQWMVVYPSTHYDTTTTSRAVILVNARLKMDAWEQLTMESPDIVAIQLKMGDEALAVYNVYNECKSTKAIQALQRHLLRRRLDTFGEAEDQLMWAGNFNLHHPLWDDPANNHLFTKTNLDRAQKLIQLLADYNMQMTLPEGIPTLEAKHTKNYTQPDNVFCSQDLAEQILYCTTVPRRTTSDHLPIFTAFDMNIARTDPVPKHNFWMVEWVDFGNALEQKTKQIARSKITSKRDFDSHLDKLMCAIHETIDEQVPITKRTPYSHCWWNSELNALQKKKAKLSIASFKKRHTCDHPIHEEYRTTKNKLRDETRKVSKEHWEQWLVNTTGQSIWIKQRIVTAEPTDGGRTRMPALKKKLPMTETTLLQTNEEKSTMLFEAFFPTQDANVSAQDNYKYPEERFRMKPIRNEQI